MSAHAAPHHEPSAPRPPAPPRDPQAPRRALGGLLAVGLALALGLALVPRPDAADGHLEPRPLPVRFDRSAPSEGEARAAEDAGLQAYDGADYARAHVELTRALAQGGRDELAVFAASALLLSGQRDPALLGPAASRLLASADGEPGPQRAEALWQALLVHHALGNLAGARAVAARLVAQEPASLRAEDARAILARPTSDTPSHAAAEDRSP